MRNIAFIITLLLVLGFSACKESEGDVYPIRSDIFFHYSLTKGPWDSDDGRPQNIVDSTVVRFGYDEVVKEDSVIGIKLRLIGSYEDFDRPINFVLIENAPNDRYLQAKENEDIELLYDRSFMLANSRQGFVYVKLKNTEKLRNAEMLATIRTAPNEYFIAEYDSIQEAKKFNVDGKIKSNTYRIIFNSIKDKPNLWAANEPNFKRNFGDYSDVKLDFIMKELRLGYEFFTYDPSTEDPKIVFNQRFPTGVINGWVILLELALEKYERENGSPLEDENGNVVKIGKYEPSGK